MYIVYKHTHNLLLRNDESLVVAISLPCTLNLTKKWVAVVNVIAQTQFLRVKASTSI